MRRIGRNLRIFLYSFFLFFLCFCVASFSFEYKSEGRRDPFLPLTVKEEKIEEEKPLARKILFSSEYKIIGLVWDKREILAIIRKGEKVWIVRKGDVIENLRVSEIKEEGIVILEGEEKIIKIRMGGGK
ncbi:hypothetical protein J7K28_08760 [Candidatus Aerophobetes bacterium]|nr:hypothetical protein [Candidatus Aerophobetes bacterium]